MDRMIVAEMDHIFIEGLRIDASVGILPWERQMTQPLKLDLKLYLPLAQSAEREDLSLSIDYVQVAETLKQLITARHFDLIETLAEQAAARLLETFPHLQAVTLTVHKPAAIPAATSTGVRIHRQRQPACA